MSAAYPGNSALPTEVRERVLATFRQTLDLYNQGALDDVIVGCDFLLKMDPLFDPAKKLREKAKNPAAPIDVQALAAVASAGAPPAPAAPPAGPAPADLSEAREAFEARDYQRASDLASAVLRSDMLNEEAQQIAEAASSRLEADPFIQQFAGKARHQLQAGDAAAARATMEKARALDPDHPLVAEVLGEIDAAPAAPPFDPFSAFGAPQGGSSFGSSEPEQPAPAGFSSFVVDSSEPKASNNLGAAPASDFGFKFEEEQEDGPAITIGHTQPGLYGFGGESAKEAAEAASGDTFDFSTASVEVSKEDQKKIQDYLSQGDIAYEAEDYQKAIDTWSRVFLIDVTNDQASERIERARLKKIAIDTQIDDLEAEAVIAAEKKDRASAKALYQKILQLDPANAAAIEQLALLDMAPAATPAAAPFAPPIAPAAPPPSSHRAAAHPFDENLFLDEPRGDVDGEILVPPDPGAAAVSDDDEDEVVAAKPVKTKTAAGGRSKMMYIAIAALLVLLAGGFAAWKIFSGGSASDAASDNTISRAQALAGRGQIDEAIAMLLAIPPDHPNHEEALSLVAELKAKKGSTVGTIDGRPAAEVYAERLQQGRAAVEANDFAAAKTAFEQAAAIQPLPPDAKQLYDRAVGQVRRLETAENLFKSGNFVEAITAAESIIQETPSNTNARDLITRAQFNLGVQALQEERLQDAVARFDQVLAVRPNDEMARRARELAVRYEGTERDLLYRIFVKYVKLR